ncbi:MAG: ribonuclease P protein component [Flavobacteriales bacterium]|nr:ribonuclease P protein component [Flavobacteriales bacterium]
METEDFGLKKEERIYKRDEIKALFSKSDSFNVFPFKVLHIEVPTEQQENLKFAVSVPKRLFKKAVDRNHLKRRVKEAYRINRNELKNKLIDSDKKLHFMLIYIAKEQLEYDFIQKKIILTLQRLQSIYAEDS